MSLIPGCLDDYGDVQPFLDAYTAEFIEFTEAIRERRRPAVTGEDARRAAYAARMVVAYLLLAAPVVAALLFWGAWGWVAAAAVVAAVEYVTLQRSQRFSARVWRSVGLTKRGKRERGTETVYVISAAVGVALLAGSLLGIG